MKAQTIAIINRRGGAGKTATAHALGTGLTNRGYKVLFIDLDSQTNLTFDLDIGVSEQPEYSSMDLLTGTANIKDIIIHREEGDVIPGSQDLATADLIITGENKEYTLKEALKPVQKKYDYIVIDTPPALGILTINSLVAADKTIIPAQAEIHSLQGIALLYQSIQEVKETANPNLKLDGILITRFNGRTILARDMKDNLQKAAALIDTKVYKAEIRECTAIKEAQATAINIFKYAPNSNAAADYNEFINEFLGE